MENACNYLKVVHQCPDCRGYLDERQLRYQPMPWGGKWLPPEHEPDKLLHCPKCQKNFSYEDVGWSSNGWYRMRS